MESFALTQCVIHQALVGANFFAFGSFNDTWLCWQVTAQKIFKFPLTNKTNTGAVFFIVGD